VAASDVQIVPPADVQYVSVTFSRDGNYVYYVTIASNGEWGTLFRIPVLGGTPQRVVPDIDSGIALSPDGTHFMFIRFVITKNETIAHLMISNAEGTDVRSLTLLCQVRWRDYRAAGEASRILVRSTPPIAARQDAGGGSTTWV
jgi:hypothetical protein